MKQHFIVILLLLSLLSSCHKENTPWPYEGDKQSVLFQISAQTYSDFNIIPSNCHLLFYDTLQGVTDRQKASQQGSNNLFKAKLFPGNYISYCITGADDDSYWNYQPEMTPEQIQIKTQTQGGSRDHLIGIQELSVSSKDTTLHSIHLVRKVARLLVIIHNIPYWLDDLQLKIDKIPRYMNLLGQYSESTQTVFQYITPPTHGTSITQLLLFPAGSYKQSHLVLSSEKHRYLSEKYEIQKLVTDQTTRVDITFKESDDLSISNFSTSSLTWNKEIIEDEWDTESPEQYLPCQGYGDGVNLVENPSFEGSWTDGKPESWKLNSSGKDKLIKKVRVPAHHGYFAAQLNGATYLYQDVPICGGECYQVKLFVNAPTDNIKWRYWFTWMYGSTPMSSFSSEVRSNEYHHQTSGYIDALEGAVVRAPSKATRLRVEIRTYNGTPLDGEGLYVDDVHVERVSTDLQSIPPGNGPNP